MERRSFLTGAAVGVAAGAAGMAAYNASLRNATAPAVAAPEVVKSTRTMTIVSTWPRDFPGLGTSAQRFAQRVVELSNGAIQTEYFAAGERVGAFDAFDEVSSGNSNAYIGADNSGTGSTQDLRISHPFHSACPPKNGPHGSNSQAAKSCGTNCPANLTKLNCP